MKLPSNIMSCSAPPALVLQISARLAVLLRVTSSGCPWNREANQSLLCTPEQAAGLHMAQGISGLRGRLYNPLIKPCLHPKEPFTLSQAVLAWHNMAWLQSTASLQDNHVLLHVLRSYLWGAVQLSEAHATEDLCPWSDSKARLLEAPG